MRRATFDLGLRCVFSSAAYSAGVTTSVSVGWTFCSKRRSWGKTGFLPKMTSYGVCFVAELSLVFRAKTISFNKDRQCFCWIPRSRRVVRNTSRTFRIFLSAKPFPWLWYAEERHFSIVNISQSSLMVWPSTFEPWSDSKYDGQPCFKIHERNKALTTSGADLFCRGLASIYFENTSPISSMYLYPESSWGNVAKSIEMNCIGASGMNNGKSDALGVWGSHLALELTIQFRPAHCLSRCFGYYSFLRTLVQEMKRCNSVVCEKEERSHHTK